MVKSKNKPLKIKPLYLAVFAITVLLIGFTGYYFGYDVGYEKSTRDSLSNNANSESITKNWKTYKSPTGSYEIRYPSHLKTHIEPAGDTAFVIYLPTEETFSVLTRSQVVAFDKGSMPNGAKYIGDAEIGGKQAMEFFAERSEYESMQPSRLNGLPFRFFQIQSPKNVESIEVGFFETPESKEIFEEILRNIKFY